jgi:hypothetical protein
VRASGKRPSAKAALNRPVAEALAILLLTPVFLHPALWNGFPLLFFDTGAYILEGFGHFFVPERSPVYSLFLRYALGRQSLWFVATAQCLIVSFVLVEFARAVRPRTTLWTMLGIGIFLSLFTGIAWIAGQIEPDCFTPVLVLAMYPLAFHVQRLGFVRGMLLALVCAFAIGCHPSHIGLAAGLALSIAFLRLAAFVFRRRVKLPRPNIAIPALAVALGMTLVFAANYSLTRKVFLTRSGPMFFTARLVGDGIAKKTLHAVCPQEPLKLCPYKDYLPKTADGFLWGPYTPFNRIGRFYGPREEYSFLVHESLKRYPVEILASGLWGAVRQFFMVRTGDGIAPAEWVLNPGFAHFMPWQSKAYLSARQQDGRLRFTGVNVVHVPLLFGALFCLALVLRQAIRRRQWGRAMLPVYLFIALIGNALVCGMFSGPHDRYQSRLVWIVPFVLLLTERGAAGRALLRPVKK